MVLMGDLELIALDDATDTINYTLHFNQNPSTPDHKNSKFVIMDLSARFYVQYVLQY